MITMIRTSTAIKIKKFWNRKQAMKNERMGEIKEGDNKNQNKYYHSNKNEHQIKY